MKPEFSGFLFMQITIEDWREFFPFKNVRIEQEKAINFALNSFISEKKKFVILELGTGVGKSATGITIARFLNEKFAIKNRLQDSKTGAYIVTTQKILQEQYLRDFGTSSCNLIKSIKSSNNYTCSFYKDQSCAESKRILNSLAKHLNGTEFQKQCKSNCAYSNEKQEFIDSSLAITNFSYILAETTYAGKLEPRQLLVVDEAHNTETELSKFIEVTFSEKFAKDVLKCRLPKSETQKSVYEWISTTYKKSLVKHMSEVEKALLKLSDDIEGYGVYSKQYEILDKHICKINRFLEVYKEENWIMNLCLPQFENKKAGKKYEFKPIDVAPYSQDTFFRLGEKVLLMSATIVNSKIFCESLGIKDEEVSFMSIPSPFPKSNRPIHFLPIGSMSKSSIDDTLPKVVEVIRMLLEKHPKEKGIIHATNYKIARYVQENIDSKRIMLHDSSNRDLVLKHHVESKDPTVLISPSMMEGVDLYDDLSRFQIICKVPFPYLGDLVVKKRMEKNRFWYPYMTAKSVIQSLGRSIRNESDHAVSYILDADWSKFYQMNKAMFSNDLNII
jgi:Rad3-related DNA helicase